MAFQGYTVRQWQLGIDVRRGATESSPQTFRDLLNCNVTPGRNLRKRPGMRAVCAMSHATGTAEQDRGMSALPDGRLMVFRSGPADDLWNDGVTPLLLANSAFVCDGATGWQGGVSGGVTLSGAYLVRHDATGVVRHWYETTNATAAVNEPNATAPGFDTVNFPGPVFTTAGRGMAAMAERIYAVDGSIVRLSDVVDPRNWLPPTGTQTQLAGYLNVGLHQSGGSRTPTALGRYKDKLVVFFNNSAQLWVTDPDPALHKLDTIVDGVGCRWPRATTNIAGDCMALSSNGLRSISIVDAFGNIADVDAGSPVDALVLASVAAMPATPGVEPCAIYVPIRQQAWFAIGSVIYVLTFSRSTNLAAWSRYVMPADVVWMEEVAGEVFVRCRFTQVGTDYKGRVFDYFDVVYTPDDAKYDDDIYDPATNTLTATPFQVRAELPFLDLGAPGSLKTFYGFDAACNGSADIYFRLNPDDPTEQTSVVTVSSDTRPGPSLPLQASSVSIQPIIEDMDSSPWEFESLTIYSSARGLR